MPQPSDDVPSLDRYSDLSEAMIDTVQNPLLVLDSELRLIRANAAFLRHFNVSLGESIGYRLDELGGGQWQIEELTRLLEEILPENKQFENYRVEGEFPDLGRRTMILNARRIPGNGARPHLILLSVADVTELENVRHELEGHREYFEKLIDSVREALIVLGWDLRVKHANKSFYDTFKVCPAETEGRLIYELGNRQWDIPELRILLEEILPKEESFDDFEIFHDFESIGPRHMLLNARRLDHLNLILLAIEDVTERDATYRRQRVLASEMSHRVKNVLALVDSISAQTARAATSLEEFQQAFHGRLAALARSHGQWLADDFQVVDLGDLLEDVAKNAGVARARIEVSGPPVEIKPTQTMPLNLTFHELCTNAVKYGSLSNEKGMVRITWSVQDGDRVRVLWKESRGPAVEPPVGKGFGFQLIESLCPFELNGKSDVRFAPDGLECELSFPIA